MSNESIGYWHNNAPLSATIDTTKGQTALYAVLTDKNMEEIRLMIREEVRKALRDLPPQKTTHELWREWQEMED